MELTESKLEALRKQVVDEVREGFIVDRTYKVALEECKGDEKEAKQRYLDLRFEHLKEQNLALATEIKTRREKSVKTAELLSDKGPRYRDPVKMATTRNLLLAFFLVFVGYLGCYLHLKSKHSAEMEKLDQQADAITAEEVIGAEDPTEF